MHASRSTAADERPAGSERRVPRSERRRTPGALLVVENHSVPADRRVWGEARSLQQAGYRVSVISPRSRHMDRTAYEYRDDICIYRFPMPFDGAQRWNFVLEYAWAHLACLWLAARVSWERGFDVLHVGNPPDFFFPLAWICKLFGKRFVFDQHDLAPETYLSKFGARKGFVYRLLLWCEGLSYRAADAVIATNESYREVMLQRGRVPADRIFVVRNSPNPRIFHPREPDATLRQGFEHLVAFVGVMGPQDGVDYLLRAAHHIVADLQRHDVFFAIIGTGDAWDRLQQLHQELDLGRYVKFLGRIPDEPMLGYLAAADVCVSPDPHNPLNDVSTMQKTMEYMAMGKPVVSFDLKESRYSAGEAAVYVPDNDARAFGQAIVDLIDDPDRRGRMAEYGRQRVTTTLSWAVSERNLLAAYAKALGSRAVEPTHAVEVERPSGRSSEALQ